MTQQPIASSVIQPGASNLSIFNPMFYQLSYSRRPCSYTWGSDFAANCWHLGPSPTTVAASAGRLNYVNIVLHHVGKLWEACFSRPLKYQKPGISNLLN